MAQYVYTMIDVGKIVPPNRTILERISLSFFPGAKIGVLGSNGSGKSSLLKIMAGIDHEHLGEARPQKDLKVGYLSQEPELNSDKDVRGNVEEGCAEIKSLLNRFDEVTHAFAEPMSDDEMNQLIEEQGDLQTRIDQLDGWELDRHLEIASEALRLPPWDADVNRLSGGERRRVALCRLLLSNPDMLLLDEPTNHLDAESVAWLERYLQDFPGTVVAVTHDRYFLDNAAGWILELDRGHGIPFEGNYSAWLAARQARLAMEQKQADSHERSIKAELEWVRTQPRGRRARNRARLERFEELNSKEFQQRNETASLYIPPGPRLGDQVIEFRHVSKRYDDKLLLDDVSFTLPKGAIVGVIGGNGAGKTTLFQLITGQEKVDEGDVLIGQTVEFAYVDQNRDQLRDEHTVWEEISGSVEILKIGQYETQSRAYVSRFNFRGTDQQKIIRDLSGGERNRVHLAKLLKRGGNLLLLDEPTNDLDVETLRALEEAILAFPGAVMVISHDRWFLDRIATHMIAFEGDSKVVWFDGNYSEYESDLRRRLGDAALQPHKVKYKKLA